MENKSADVGPVQGQVMDQRMTGAPGRRNVRRGHSPVLNVQSWAITANVAVNVQRAEHGATEMGAPNGVNAIQNPRPFQIHKEPLCQTTQVCLLTN